LDARIAGAEDVVVRGINCSSQYESGSRVIAERYGIETDKLNEIAVEF